MKGERITLFQTQSLGEKFIIKERNFNRNYNVKKYCMTIAARWNYFVILNEHYFDEFILNKTFYAL